MKRIFDELFVNKEKFIDNLLNKIETLRTGLNQADEMIEGHFEENLQVTTQIFDEIRLRSRCHSNKACGLGKEVFGDHRSKEKSMVPIERHNAISKQQWTDLEI